METDEITLPALIDPALEMADAYREFLWEFVNAGEEGVLLDPPEDAEPPGAAVRRLLDYAEGRNLPEGWVPCTACWLVSRDGRLLGEIRIRHRLTPFLEDYGGHIGYMVRPSERGRGYASRMLALALEKARGLGLGRVLITCDPANIASARVIQKNGGQLSGQTFSKMGGRMTSRYWIDL